MTDIYIQFIFITLPMLAVVLAGYTVVVLLISVNE